MKQMNLIGISGKIDSGKDTVFEIIQKLCLTNNGPSWENKKFADKLKDIVCILLGCTREQLEDREFKEKVLGEEWNIVKLKLPFGTEFKEINKIFNSIEEAHNYAIETGYTRYEAYVKALTPRLLLQLLGTECGRDIIHPNIWVNSLFADYKSERQTLGGDGVWFTTDKDYINFGERFISPNWIITDVRFPNEAQAIKDRGGIVIRVNRPGYGTSITDLASAHPSETALDGFEFDYTINNDGDLEKLISLVRDILEKENII